MAAAAEASAPKKSSLVMQAALLAGLTVATIGTGWLTGNYLTGPAGGSGSAPVRQAPETTSADAAQSLNIFRLQDVTTNLAGSGDVWVRLEAVLVFTDTPDPQLAEVIHQDLLAFLRTVKPQQVEGPSGFQHLRNDLNERVVIRSEGKVREMLIRTLLFE